MTREELREHCERQIKQFERAEKIMPVTPNDWRRYEEHKLILELLEQETVPREHYEHEFFLRKELDFKVAKLEKQIAEQEPCEDAVSRRAAIDKLKEHYWDKELQSAKDDPCIIDAMTDLDIRVIKALPSVTPAPKKCHNENKDYDDCDQFVCSNCGNHLDIRGVNAEAESWRNWAIDIWHELQELVYAKRLNRKKLIALAERMENDL